MAEKKFSLNDLMRERYGGQSSTARNLQLRPQARASPSSPVAPSGPGRMVPQVIVDRMQRPGPLPKGRVSRSDSDIGGGWWWNAGTLGSQDRQSVIQQIRELVVTDSDAAGALRDLVALANPGVTLKYSGSETAKKQAGREIDRLTSNLGDFPGLDELINNQLAETYIAGASSAEWYPNPGRSGVGGVEVVPAEEVQIRREGNERTYVQLRYDVALDSRTFVYSPYATRGRDPYGTPAIVAALIEIQRKAALTVGIDKVINLLSQGAFLQLEVPKPTLEELNVESESDPAYWEALATYYNAYVDLATSSREAGVMVTEAGVSGKALPLTGNVSGLAELKNLNSLSVWSAVLTLPFMRGKMDSTTQALAQVVYPILLAHAINMQTVVKRVIEFGLNLHLQLCGIAASVELDFLAAPNPFTLDHARAAREQAQADGVYMEQMGDEMVRLVAVRLGLDPEKVLAWRKEHKPAPAPLSLTQSETAGTDQQQGSDSPAGGGANA